MRALTVEPRKTGSAAVSELPDPEPGDGELLVEGVVLGSSGTDREIDGGQYGWAPPGRDRLVLGHESLGRVRHAPIGSVNANLSHYAAAAADALGAAGPGWLAGLITRRVALEDFADALESRPDDIKVVLDLG